MGRPPRAFVDGLFHVAPHASDSRHLFPTDEDRWLFLDRLVETVEQFELRLVAYALMSTHYHAILGTPGGRISEALQQAHTWYSQTHNRKRGRRAHLFRAHFFAREIESDEDLITVCRYVAQNPVLAGLAPTPFDWLWSSAAATAGLARPTIPLDETPIRAALGGRGRWRDRYRDVIGDTPKPAGATDGLRALLSVRP